MPSSSDSLWYCDKMLSKEPDKHWEDLRNACVGKELSTSASVPFTATCSHTPKKLGYPTCSKGSHTWLDFHSFSLPFLQVWNHKIQWKALLLPSESCKAVCFPILTTSKESNGQMELWGLRVWQVRFRHGFQGADSLGSIVFAFPACIIYCNKSSPVFLWELLTFSPYGLGGGDSIHQADLGPSNLWPLSLFQRWTGNPNQVKQNLCPYLL